MPDLDTLTLVPAAPTEPLTADQKRFNTLLRQLEKARKTLADWHLHAPAFAEAYAEQQSPLLAQLAAVRREWTIALDALLSKQGWARQERETLKTLALESSRLLLSEGRDDAELEAIFAKHSGRDLGSAEDQAQTMALVRAMAEQELGVDLGDDSMRDEETLRARIDEAFRARQEALAAEDAAAPPRPRTTHQRRRDEQAQLAKQSVRDVFRKLASALHPDREPDADRRTAKTALMQRVNEAYAKDDLLTLLELQSETAQLDAGHAARGDPQQVKLFNKVLAEQLSTLRAEIRNIGDNFRLDFNLGWGSLDPLKLDNQLRRVSKEVQGQVNPLRDEMVLLSDAALTRQWLKQVRREMDLRFDFD